MNQIVNLLLIALFVEAIVTALKPMWSHDSERFSVSEYVSMVICIVIAVSCRLNMLSFLVELPVPGWMNWFFYVLTGIAMGRGTNFIHDLWGKLNEYKNIQFVEDGSLEFGKPEKPLEEEETEE